MKRPPKKPAEARLGLLVAALWLVSALVVALTALTWEPPVFRVLHIHRIELTEPAVPEKQTYPPKHKL